MKTALKFLLLAFVGFCAACAPEKSKIAAGDSFPLRGEVITVMVDKKSALVAHEAIPGLMPAMAMEFTLSMADLATLKPGQRIAARLFVVREGVFELRAVVPLDPAQAQAIETRAKELRQDTLIRGRKAYREIGEQAPPFALLNQDGQTVDFERFRGKQVVMNFIYTRCPVATMCPAATVHMQELQRAAKEKSIQNLELVSISFDPDFDTPAVLKEYARARGIDTKNFTFLTGSETAIRDLLLQFGVIAKREDNIYKHTLATILFDQNGRIIHRVDGSQWTAEDFVKRLTP